MFSIAPGFLVWHIINFAKSYTEIISKLYYIWAYLVLHNKLYCLQHGQCFIVAIIVIMIMCWMNSGRRRPVTEGTYVVDGTSVISDDLFTKRWGTVNTTVLCVSFNNYCWIMFVLFVVVVKVCAFNFGSPKVDFE